jgi:hypothetical protein
MAGFVPAIHVFLDEMKDVDARHKAGHDEFRFKARSIGCFLSQTLKRPQRGRLEG